MKIYKNNAIKKVMPPNLIAPCGMNCGICSAHLREKNPCPGCRLLKTIRPSVANCKMRTCKLRGKAKFCFACKAFPCPKLQHLDERYRTKYNMSEIENLEQIKKNGVRDFIKKEKIKWTCPKCGGTINVHKGICSKCGV